MELFILIIELQIQICLPNKNVTHFVLCAALCCYVLCEDKIEVLTTDVCGRFNVHLY